MKWIDHDMMRMFESINSTRRDNKALNAVGGIELRTRWKGQTIASLVTAFTTPSWYEVITERLEREAVSQSTVDVRLVDMRGSPTAVDLTKVWTEASEQGREQAASELLAGLVPQFRNLAIMAVGDGYELGLGTSEGMTPLSMAGDGVRALARLVLELASRPRGVVLVEEPEVHQHPSSLEQTGAAIVAAVGRGLQVVMTTHSLELIDWLLIHAREHELLDKVNVQRVRLAGGTLHSTTFGGQEADEIRHVVNTELRG
jgi:hypothetical protein